MKTSENGIDFIKRAEGFAPRPYDDNGKTAWGFGHDRQLGEQPPVQISREDADLLLRNDLATRFEPIVSAHVPLDCTQGQFDACVDFCFNLGPSSFRMMVGHGWQSVPEQMLRWTNVNSKPNAGLSARRNAEVALFNS